MRVCPKCGYVEPAYWLPSRWRTTEYCRLDDLKTDQPEIARKLLDVPPMEIIADNTFAYRMNEAGFVERIWVLLYNSGGKSAFNLSREAHHFNPKFRHPSQTKLSRSH